MNRSLESPSDRSVVTGPPLPGKRGGKIKVERQTPHTSLHGNSLKDNIHYVDSAEVVRNPLEMQFKIDYHDASTKKMDDSAIWSSETDLSYDDMDAQLLSSSSTESAGLLSNSAKSMTACMSNFESKICSYDHRLGFLETQLISNKGSYNAAVKEMEQIRSLLDHMSTKVKVFN